MTRLGSDVSVQAYVRSGDRANEVKTCKDVNASATPNAKTTTEMTKVKVSKNMTNPNLGFQNQEVKGPRRINC